MIVTVIVGWSRVSLNCVISLAMVLIFLQRLRNPLICKRVFVFSWIPKWQMIAFCWNFKMQNFWNFNCSEDRTVTVVLIFGRFGCLVYLSVSRRVINFALCNYVRSDQGPNCIAREITEKVDQGIGSKVVDIICCVGDQIQVHYVILNICCSKPCP